MLAQQINLVTNKKPLVYVLSSRTCGDCRDFMDSWKRIERVTLSQVTAQFLAVLALDDYVLELGTGFSPLNGDYLPRVFFADADGTLRLDWKNPAADAASPYYYNNAQEVVDNMRRFLQQHWEGLGVDVFPGDLQMDI